MNIHQHFQQPGSRINTARLSVLGNYYFAYHTETTHSHTEEANPCYPRRIGLFEMTSSSTW